MTGTVAQREAVTGGERGRQRQRGRCHYYAAGHVDKEGVLNATRARSSLIGVLCSFSPGVKVAALILSSAEAGTPLCAMPRMLRLAGMPGIVGCSEGHYPGAVRGPLAAANDTRHPR